jgi:hypothetical protein
MNMLRPCARHDDVICEEVSGDCVVYDVRRKKAHHLNATLSWIWNSCDGQTSLETMAEGFERQFGATNSTEVLVSGLQQLERCELLQEPVQLPNIMSQSMSRRSVMAGTVLMPAVVSIVAPTPAAAKSKEKKEKKDK